jgi:hypothetical protein
MSLEAAIALAIIIIMTSLVAVIAMMSRRHRQAKEDDLRQAASSRGWTFQSAVEKAYRVHRWTGTADGISWTAESLSHTSGQDKSHRRRHISRWQAAWSPGINGPIVVMGLPKGKESLGTGIAAGDGVFAKIAQKAAGFAFDKALDVYFGETPGKEVDAAALHRVDREEIPGFVVMAADKDEGARILEQGLERLLIDGAADEESVFSEKDRVWILLRPNAISLARTAPYRDAAEIERFNRAGVALARVFKFGRIGGS